MKTITWFEKWFCCARQDGDEVISLLRAARHNPDQLAEELVSYTHDPVIHHRSSMSTELLRTDNVVGGEDEVVLAIATIEEPVHIGQIVETATAVASDSQDAEVPEMGEPVSPTGVPNLYKLEDSTLARCKEQWGDGVYWWCKPPLRGLGVQDKVSCACGWKYEGDIKPEDLHLHYLPKFAEDPGPDATVAEWNKYFSLEVKAKELHRKRMNCHPKPKVVKDKEDASNAPPKEPETKKTTIEEAGPSSVFRVCQDVVEVKRHRRLPHPKRRDYAAIVISDIKNRLGCPAPNAANLLAVRRMAKNIIDNHGLRPTHARVVIERVVAGVFVPDEEDLLAAQVLQSVGMQDLRSEVADARPRSAWYALFHPFGGNRGAARVREESA